MSDFSSTCKDDILGDPKNKIMVNQIICQHFYREGITDIADEFLKVNYITLFKYPNLFIIFNFFVF